MKKNIGGQAFPRTGFIWTYRSGEVESEPSEDGMTLRDYFAAKALPTVIPRVLDPLKNEAPVWKWDEAALAIAATCYRIADAMLAEREK